MLVELSASITVKFRNISLNCIKFNDRKQFGPFHIVGVSAETVKSKRLHAPST